MARLFISHSSRDDVYALARQGRLAADGRDRSGVLIDPDDSSAGGRRHTPLRKANAALRAAILPALPHVPDSIASHKGTGPAGSPGTKTVTAAAPIRALRRLIRNEPDETAARAVRLGSTVLHSRISQAQSGKPRCAWSRPPPAPAAPPS